VGRRVGVGAGGSWSFRIVPRATCSAVSSSKKEGRREEDETTASPLVVAIVPKSKVKAIVSAIGLFIISDYLDFLISGLDVLIVDFVSRRSKLKFGMHVRAVSTHTHEHDTLAHPIPACRMYCTPITHTTSTTRSPIESLTGTIWVPIRRPFSDRGRGRRSSVVTPTELSTNRAELDNRLKYLSEREKTLDDSNV
jgi:hypothetical protein